MTYGFQRLENTRINGREDTNEKDYIGIIMRLIINIVKSPPTQKHYHKETEENIKKSHIPDEPEKAIKYFLDFIRDYIKT